MYVCVVICLSHCCCSCYYSSYFVRIVDRTRKNVVVLVQSILQLNQPSFSLVPVHTTSTARYISFLSFLQLLSTVWKEIEYQQTIEYSFPDKDNHSIQLVLCKIILILSFNFYWL
jgi:hypothetical protein